MKRKKTMQGLAKPLLKVGMISLPEGDIRFIDPVLNQKMNQTGQVSLDTLLPDKQQQEISELIQAFSSGAKQAAARIDHDALNMGFSVAPVFDGERLCALLWYIEEPKTLPIFSEDKLFHRSVIPGWVIDVSDLYQYLLFLTLETHQQLDEYIARHADFIPTVIELVPMLEANTAFARLFDEDYAIDLVKQQFAELFSKEDICHLCHAVIGIKQQSTRYGYFSHFQGSGRSYWVNAEVPSVKHLSQGILFSAVDMTPVQLSDRAAIDKAAFLASIVETQVDYLFIFDHGKEAIISFQEASTPFSKVIAHEIESLKKLPPTEMLATLNEADIKGWLLAKYSEHSKIFALTDLSENLRYLEATQKVIERDDGGNVLTSLVLVNTVSSTLKKTTVLEAKQSYYETLADNFSDVVVTLDADLSVEHVSQSSYRLLGYDETTFQVKATLFSVLGLSRFEVDIGQFIRQVKAGVVVNKVNDITVETTAIKASGEAVSIEMKITPILSPSNDFEGLLMVGRDITERRAADVERHLAMQVFDNSLDGIYITAKSGLIVQVNKAFESITGFQSEDVLGQKPSVLSSGWHEISFEEDILPVVKEKHYWEGELMSRRKDGEAFQAQLRITALYDTDEEYLGLITSFKDVTEAKSSEENIKRLAYYDPLTNLPNRSLFNDRLEQALQRGNRSRLYVAVLFIDLDGFKSINDTLGHANGDRLLTEVGARLKNTVRSDDTVARMGGDEFNVILNALQDRETAESATANIANKIVKRIAEPFIIQGHAIKIGCSIGISLYPDDSISAEELIKQADTAMYHTKQLGKNGYQFYTQDLLHKTQEKNKLEDDLLATNVEDEFALVFQPRYEVSDMPNLIGFDASIRWMHPERGLIKPNVFLATAEELGLSIQIGEWLIEEACRQLSAIAEKTNRTFTLSIKMFERHYREADLVGDVIKNLEKYDIEPSDLIVEISQEILMKDAGFAFALLTELRSVGVRLSIDGFGTSMLSLQAINRLPVDEVKLQRRLTQHIEEQAEDLRLLTSLLGIAESLGLDVIAENIETVTQLTLLESLVKDPTSRLCFSRAYQRPDMDTFIKMEAFG